MPIWCHCSQVRVSLLGTHKHKISSEGSLRCEAGQAVAQLGMSLLGGSCPSKDEPLELRDKCLYYDSQLGLPSSEHGQTGRRAISDEPFGR